MSMSMIIVFLNSKSFRDCLGSYNSSAPAYTNTTIDDALRSWEWLRYVFFLLRGADSQRMHDSCNEVGYFRDAAPIGHPTLVSRLNQPSSDEVCVAYQSSFAELIRDTSRSANASCSSLPHSPRPPSQQSKKQIRRTVDGT